jgi:3-oxoacyl-[acyl-carrier-protein] synthase-3
LFWSREKETPLQFKFDNVRIDSFATNMPTKAVSSSEIEERLAPVFKRLKIPFGTFEKLTGIKTRCHWDEAVPPSQVATVAAAKALGKSSLKPDQIQALFNCSITRDYFEPATSCIVHHELGLPECAVVFDISNACLGFMNGIVMMSNLIESGIIGAGILVSGETIVRPTEHCIKHILSQENLTRDELIKLLPTLTLGSGSVAYVLAHKSLTTSTHKILGGVTRSATKHHELCNGNGDFCHFHEGDFDPIMTTESSKLIGAAAKLGRKAWPQLAELVGWNKDDVDHIFCHQVGKQVNDAFYKEMGLDFRKEFTIYERYGNLASAAVPTALAIGAEEKDMKPGDKVVLTGFGSGLNALFLGIEW